MGAALGKDGQDSAILGLTGFTSSLPFVKPCLLTVATWLLYQESGEVSLYHGVKEKLWPFI